MPSTNHVTDLSAALAQAQPHLLVDLQAATGECPLWSAPEQCLYCVDIPARRIHRINLANAQVQSWSAPEEPGCLALIEPGVLMVALRSGFARFDTRHEQWGSIVTTGHDTTTQRFNDGRCDARGRFWASTMFEPRTAAEAALYCLERGQARLVLGPAQAAGVVVGNGLAFDAARGWLYRSDTTRHVIYRHAYDVNTGKVGSGNVWRRFDDDRSAPGYGGRPDGATLDVEGCYWCAMIEGARVLRLNHAGEICGELPLPVRRPTMVAFGGEDLRTLFITSARSGASAEELARHPHSGGVWMVRVDVAGLEEPRYREA